MLKKTNVSQNLLYNKFLGVLIKNGKITKAKKIFDTALFNVSKKLKFSINLILYKIFHHLNTFVETKRVRRRKKINLIPFPILFSRRIYLILKWVLISVKQNKTRVSIVTKLSIEIFKIVKNLPSNALKSKTLNNSQAYLNRSNIHFRW